MPEAELFSHESRDRGECSGGEPEIFVGSENDSKGECFKEFIGDSGFCGVAVNSLTKTRVSEVSVGEEALTEVETVLFKEEGMLQVKIVFLILA